MVAMEASAPPPPPAESSVRMCVSCGRKIDFASNVCPYCGHDYRTPAYAPVQKPKSAMPVVGGVLVLIAGILAIGMGIFYIALDASQVEDSGVALPSELTTQDLQNILDACGAVLLVFGIIALLGGIFSLQRKHFVLGVFGGIFGMIGIGFFLGAVLSLIGLILIVVSRHEFQ
jgi:hypothetical protein